MRTVNEVSKLTGVSVRTLHYYDEIGLLRPAVTTNAGYRLYDDASLERLQQILLFKELEFSLKDIKKIIDCPGFDRKRALAEQIRLLKIKTEHFENLISYAERIIAKGEYKMDFKIFDNEKYKAEAKKLWGNTKEYREYEKKTACYSSEKQESVANELMNIFKEFGSKTDLSPADAEIQSLVKKLQNFITDNYYTCTNETLCGLGQIYSAGGEMTDNIDSAGGKGTAEFTAKAITEYCKQSDNMV